MPFRGIQGKGVKGRSGRKSKAAEIEHLREKLKEEVTQEMLVKLANRVVYKQLEDAEIKGSIIGAKEFALPVTLKGMTDKVKHSGTVQVIRIDSNVADKYEPTSGSNPSSESEE